MSNETIVKMSADEYWSDIKSPYILELSNKTPDEIYASNNPGPTKPDGSMNFECHCVGHLVASPCGYEFRNAILCQKSASDEQMKEGACGNELVSFMECVTRFKCFSNTNTDTN